MTTAFEFKFHGAEVDDGSIEVEDFAAAALAIGTLIQETNKTLNGDRATVSVRLKADPFRPGSFETVIELGLSIVDHARLLIGTEQINTGQDLLEALGFCVKADGATGGVLADGLIGLLKWLRGKKEKEIRQKTGGISLVVATNGSSVHVHQNVVNILNNHRVPKALNDALKPLEREGIDWLEFSDVNVPAGGNRITREDREDFQQIAEQREQDHDIDEHTSVYERLLGLVSVSFEGGYVWRFTDGRSRFTASMSDPDFLARVEGGAAVFRSGTLLRVRVKTTTTFTESGAPQTRHTIVKVLQMTAPPVQRKLPLDTETKDEEQTSDQEAPPTSSDSPSQIL